MTDDEAKGARQQVKAQAQEQDNRQKIKAQNQKDFMSVL